MHISANDMTIREGSRQRCAETNAECRQLVYAKTTDPRHKESCSIEVDAFAFPEYSHVRGPLLSRGQEDAKSLSVVAGHADSSSAQWRDAYDVKGHQFERHAREDRPAMYLPQYKKKEWPGFSAFFLSALITIVAAFPAVTKGAGRHKRAALGIASRLLKYVLHIVVVAWLVPLAQGFVLVGNRGDITLLGPIDIDPALEDARVAFKKDGATKWAIKSMNLYTAENTGQQDLVFTSSLHKDGLIAFTPDGAAFFNTTLSVLQKVNFGNELSVAQAVNLGSQFSVSEVAYLYDEISVAQQANLGYRLRVLDQTNLGRTLTVLDQTNLGSCLSVSQYVRLGSTLSVRSFVRLGSYLSIGSYIRLGSSLSVFGTVRFGSSHSVLDFVALGSSFSVTSFTRLGAALSLYRMANLGSSMSVLDFVQMGSMLSTSAAL